MISSVTIEQFYFSEVVATGLLLTYVMIKAEQDPHNSDNEAWLKRARCGAYTIGSLIVSATALFGRNLPPEAFALGSILLSLSIPILLVDAYKLHRRSVPPNHPARVKATRRAF